MTNATESEHAYPILGSDARVRDWRIFTFLVSVLAVPLAIEVICLR